MFHVTPPHVASILSHRTRVASSCLHTTLHSWGSTNKYVYTYILLVGNISKTCKYMSTYYSRNLEIKTWTFMSFKNISKTCAYMSTYYSRNSEIKWMCSLVCFVVSWSDFVLESPFFPPPQKTDILFQKNWHFFGFYVRVDFSKLEVPISTITSENNIQTKGFRMI